MFLKAKAERDSHLIRLETFDNFVKTLDAKNLILAPWCERVACEKDVKERSTKQLSYLFWIQLFYLKLFPL